MSQHQGTIGRFAILLTLCISLALTQARAEAPAASAEVSHLVPMAEGPLHEAFLSPRRDQLTARIPQTPPSLVVETPSTKAPSSNAQWIEGYWEWSTGLRNFVWVTGTWRVPPPGRLWVNGYWKQEEDGWRRIQGFWSDRPTDHITFRSEAPPSERPVDDPGPPPKTDCFYIPAQYVPEQAPEDEGVVWRKGFWTDVKTGWAWVPASWVRQPAGWVYQEGYWDLPLEDRGVLFAPAQMVGEIHDDVPLTYRPYTVVSSELYGQLYGAFGRSSSLYDGYPGVSYDQTGRFFAFADYGSLVPYYGYLDYPWYGSFGYPYYASPSGFLPTSAYPIGAMTYGMGLPYYGFGGALLPLMTGYPLFGNMAFAGTGWGWGYPGWGIGGAGLANPVWSGVALGTWPGLNWGSWMWSGPAIGAWPAFGWNIGFPNWYSGWGGGGWGLNQFGWGGWNGWGWGFSGPIWGAGLPIRNDIYPFQNSGRREFDPNNLTTPNRRVGQVADRPSIGRRDDLAERGSMRTNSSAPLGRELPMQGMREERVAPPPSSRPFASLIDRPPPRWAGEAGDRRGGAFGGVMRDGVGERAAAWTPAFNGVSPNRPAHREAARPVFTGRGGTGGEAAPMLGRMRSNPEARSLEGQRALDTMRPNPDPGMRGGFAPQLRDDPAVTRVLGLEGLRNLQQGEPAARSRPMGGMSAARAAAGVPARRNPHEEFRFDPRLHAPSNLDREPVGRRDAGDLLGGMRMAPGGTANPGVASGAMGPGPGWSPAMRSGGQPALDRPAPPIGNPGFTPGLRPRGLESNGGNLDAGGLGSGFVGGMRQPRGINGGGFGAGTYNPGVGSGLGPRGADVGFGGMRGSNIGGGMGGMNPGGFGGMQGPASGMGGMDPGGFGGVQGSVGGSGVGNAGGGMGGLSPGGMNGGFGGQMR